MAVSDKGDGPMTLSGRISAPLEKISSIWNSGEAENGNGEYPRSGA